MVPVELLVGLAARNGDTARVRDDDIVTAVVCTIGRGREELRGQLLSCVRRSMPGRAFHKARRDALAWS